MVAAIEFAGRSVGPGTPCFVIAEAGVNHGGQLELAHRLVDVACEAGADAVKFQTFVAERLVTRDAPKAEYQEATTGAGEPQRDMLRRLELAPDDYAGLKAHCGERGIIFLSTPFDEESADSLDAIGVPAFKVSSGDLTNMPLLERIGSKKKPVLLSTGMSTLDEIASGLSTLELAGARGVILLHCVSEYPAPASDANLRAMQMMAARFERPIGFSDHTLGIEVALAAVALGACVIEKHFTLDRSLIGPDHRASLEPDELSALVHGIRTVEQALGSGVKEPALGELGTARVARRSLVAARDIPAGTILTEDLIAVKRPGTGLPPSMRPQLVGRKVRVAVSADSLLSLDVLA